LTIVAVFVGPAGSGKTTLVHRYGEWLRRHLFLKTAIVNLDPGAEILPYKPTLDIREFFTLTSIMEKYGLGPNGAFLKASELLAEFVDEVMEREPFSNIGFWDIVLIDTPGQMEAFVFRRSSTVFFKALEKIAKPVVVFVIDASAAETLADAITLWFMHVLVQVKTGLVTVPVVNKVDVARSIDYLRMIVEKPEELLALSHSDASEGILSDIAPDLLTVAFKTKAPVRTVFVSALKQEDFSNLHFIVHEAFCACGDLT